MYNSLFGISLDFCSSFPNIRLASEIRLNMSSSITILGYGGESDGLNDL